MAKTIDAGKVTASVTVGTVTTGAAGTDAKVTNTGTVQDAVFAFTIPQGEQGPHGDAVTAAAINSQGHLILTVGA